MSIRTLIVGMLALVCGASAAVGVTHLRKRPLRSSRTETVPVVVAVRQIPPGRMLTPDDVRVRNWPKEMTPDRALKSLDEAQNRAATVLMVAGEPVLGTKLASKSASRGLAALVPKEIRAYPIQTAKVAASVEGGIRSHQEEPKPKVDPSPPPQPPRAFVEKPQVYEIITFRGEHRGRIVVTGKP